MCLNLLRKESTSSTTSSKNLGMSHSCSKDPGDTIVFQKIFSDKVETTVGINWFD